VQRACNNFAALANLDLPQKRPATVEQGSGSLTVEFVAQDASGVDYAYIAWTNPAGSPSKMSCSFSHPSNLVSGTCTVTEPITSGDSRWIFSGDYINPYVRIYDVNNNYEDYAAGFSLPDLTVE